MAQRESLGKRCSQLEQEIAALKRHMHELNAIGVSLSTEKNLDALLDKILRKTREITQADSGSLYLIEEVGGDQQSSKQEKRICFKLAQNDSVSVTFSEFTLPVDRKSIVGYAALTGESRSIDDVYELKVSNGFQHNRDFDQRADYRTKSMLVVPMKNQKDEVIGVLQLINKKTAWSARLTQKNTATQVLAFTATDMQLVESLASQASVAIENTRLYEEIENLFEGFIRASVLAIEARDPTTSGHSERVATMTCQLAEVVDKEKQGLYGDVRFNSQDMKELRYAALLHDFGKIGVREEVLVKAKKLYPYEIEVIKSRFQLIQRSMELDYSKKKFDIVVQQSREAAQRQLQALDSELANRLQELDHDLELILRSTEPTVLEEGDFRSLQEVANKQLITPEEVRFLSIRKGSLSEKERLAIEAHVTHSFNFLKQIPWTKDLRRIPPIAYAHHEKLDGSGYPRKIGSEQIPFQTKIMTITDIFDALAARDRPYKKAVPVQRALEILQMEVDEGKLDAELFRLFLEAKIFKLIGR